MASLPRVFQPLETTQRLEKRIDQHLAAIRRDDGNHSGMVEHCLQELHGFSKTDVRILHQNLKYFKSRKIAESHYIKKTINTCNRDSGLFLPEVYSPLFA